MKSDRTINFLLGYCGKLPERNEREAGKSVGVAREETAVTMATDDEVQ
jgi:hypothetical protein